jgi:hypothetical protein
VTVAPEPVDDLRHHLEQAARTWPV